MGLPMYLVDAFSHAPFTGNPAAVCLLNEAADEKWMQQVGMEMNQAETAFITPDNGQFNLRWFTPSVEVDLCGHATLASAHVVYHESHLSPGTEAKFHTKSGILTCRLVGDEIEMDFPSEAPSESPLPTSAAAIQNMALWTGKNRMDWFAQFRNEKDVLSFEPDFDKINAMGMRGLVVTAKADRQGADYVSRFFAPQSGIDEDHVTGSAHCCLGPFWTSILGRDDLTGYQASARGGFVRTQVLGDRVVLGGQARIVFSGTLST